MLANGNFDLFAGWYLSYSDLLAIVARVEPHRGGSIKHIKVPSGGDHLAGFGPQFNDVTFAGTEAGYVDPSTVDVYMSVTYELASLRPGCGPASSVDDVVESEFEKSEKIFACNSTLPGSLVVGIAELLFGDSVGEPSFLFFLKLD